MSRASRMELITADFAGFAFTALGERRRSRCCSENSDPDFDCSELRERSQRRMSNVGVSAVAIACALSRLERLQRYCNDLLAHAAFGRRSRSTIYPNFSTLFCMTFQSYEDPTTVVACSVVFAIVPARLVFVGACVGIAGRRLGNVSPGTLMSCNSLTICALSSSTCDSGEVCISN